MRTCRAPSGWHGGRGGGAGAGWSSPPSRPRLLTAQQRLLLLDTWRRSGLPAGDFGALIGLSKHTLYAWKKKFDQQGPAGLMAQPRGGPCGSKLLDLTRRRILMLKEANPSWGCQRISDMLARGPALPASAAAVARVLRRPQTLGKIERFWGSLWRECVESAVFLDLGDAQKRIGLFIDHYNFQRTHAGIDGLVPADRYFGAAAEVQQALAARVAANALTLARHGVPKAPLYLTGQVGGQPVSLHAEGERVILTGPEGARQEIDLAASAGRQELPEPVCLVGLAKLEPDAEPAPGRSPLDTALPPVGIPQAPAPQTDDVPETAGGGA